MTGPDRPTGGRPPDEAYQVAAEVASEKLRFGQDMGFVVDAIVEAVWRVRAPALAGTPNDALREALKSRGIEQSDDPADEGQWYVAAEPDGIVCGSLEEALDAFSQIAFNDGKREGALAGMAPATESSELDHFAAWVKENRVDRTARLILVAIENYRYLSKQEAASAARS